MSIESMNKIILSFSKKMIVKDYKEEFYKKFKIKEIECLEKMIPDVPDIGDSIFKSSYPMGVCFIAWYKVLLELGLSQEEVTKYIWKAIENMIKKVPKLFVPVARKIYLGGILKKAESHTIKSEKNELPEFDWKVKYVKVDENTFRLDTYECGVKKLCEKFGVKELLPSMCRLDYLTAHYLHHGFVRDKTLGDGDELCNNTYSLTGECKWSPEEGFVNRK